MRDQQKKQEEMTIRQPILPRKGKQKEKEQIIIKKEIIASIFFDENKFIHFIDEGAAPLKGEGPFYKYTREFLEYVIKKHPDYRLSWQTHLSQIFQRIEKIENNQKEGQNVAQRPNLNFLQKKEQELERRNKIVLDNPRLHHEFHFFNKKAQEVLLEFYRCKQFLRTERWNTKTLYLKYSGDYKIEHWVLWFFEGRFPSYNLLLFNPKKHKLFWLESYSSAACNGQEKKNIERRCSPIFYRTCHNEKEIMKTCITSTFNNVEKIMEKKKNEDELLYHAFYRSQYISSRKNDRYYRHMLPKKWEEKEQLWFEREFYRKEKRRVSKIQTLKKYIS